MLPKDTDKREFSARVTWHCKNISAQNTVKFATFFRETWVVGRRKLLRPGSMGSTLRSNCQKKVSCLSDTSAPYHEVYLQASSYSRISLAAVFPHQIYTTIKGRVGERREIYFIHPSYFPTASGGVSKDFVWTVPPSIFWTFFYIGQTFFSRKPTLQFDQAKVKRRDGIILITKDKFLMPPGQSPT